MDKRNAYDITYMYIVVPPISILLFNCATKIALLVKNYTVPNDMDALDNQYKMLEKMYNDLMQEGGDKRRHNRGSREERLPNGCLLRQRICLPNNTKKEYHEMILHKRNDSYVCSRTNKIYKTLHQANEAHYVECGKVWSKEDTH